VLLDTTFYHNRTPGLIITALVCLFFIGWALLVAWINFGPGAKRPQD
jgi:hypothetical protein